MKKRSLDGKSAALPLRGRMLAQPSSWQDELRAKAQASLSALLHKPSETQSPRRWKDKLQAADARAQAGEAEAQRHAALARSAEERARIAEARATQMEQRARAAENRAETFEQRALTAEAMVARLEKEQIADASPSPAPDHADALRQLEAAQEAAWAAQERARKAEMRAWDMEQRSLAAEAIIAGSR